MTESELIRSEIAKNFFIFAPLLFWVILIFLNKNGNLVVIFTNKFRFLKVPHFSGKNTGNK